jgi:homoaconitate hydratase family protein
MDLCEVNDLYLQVIRSFDALGAATVFDPDKVVFVLDHYAPAPTIKSAANQKVMREFVLKHGIRHLFDINEGICHQVMAETGLVYPGLLLVATDSHTTTHGALGAFGTGVGATDLAIVLARGELWFRVPEVMKIVIAGRLQPAVMAKDVILHVIRTLGTDAAVYKAVEFTGDTIASLSMSERMVLCNMSVEMGAKTAYVQPDAVTEAYLKDKACHPYTVSTTDNDFVYDAVTKHEVDTLEPQVALPHSVDNVVPISEVEPVKVDQAFIGTCTGGRLEDIATAAKIIRGKKIARQTRLLVIPASRRVCLEAIDQGYARVLMEAGAVLSAPGCGPCLGAHQGILAAGETCISASSRNFRGRMGSGDARIYLASPATVAASAIVGKITDPRRYL